MSISDDPFTPDVRVASGKRVARVAVWNVQRGGSVGAVADKLKECRADIVLLCECDVGMARSGNVDTVSEIADRLDMAHAFAVEFEELGLGNDVEQRIFAGRSNTRGLHGNAVLSRFPILEARKIDLTNGNEWPRSDQPRRGGRMAVAAELSIHGSELWFAVTHFESRTTPEKRARQMHRLMLGLNKLGANRCVLGGDLNNKAGEELMFDLAEDHGFKWRDQNKVEGRWKDNRLDWFMCRGIETRNPQTIDCAGISDHDLITLEVLTA